MCSKPKAPKVQPMPSPPPPATVITEDTAAIDERSRERRRQGTRAGRQSTILAGDTAAAGVEPTTQAKTVLGA
jgi:hypothetical protein